MQPHPDNESIPRYSQRPLPSYRHLPFQNPHPFLDEDGHSYGEELNPLEGFGSDNWQESTEYLYAIDLFNHGYWWEAHERLKPLSLGAGRETETGRFVQGLIQLAAALLKLSQDDVPPARSLAELGIANLQASADIGLGIAVADLIAEVTACLDDSQAPQPIIHLDGVEEH
ncbi:MAG: hypothetical protein C0622_12155 [Desulfuromonas sp.]|nr:MAG: hypothetical protein C0622_12155 [Desulfuromonas sp.]